VSAGASGSGEAARARAGHHAAHAAVCDVVEPWEHGTVVRATRYPRDVALRRHAQVLAVLENDAPVAFAQLERDGDAAEITQVYVRPEYRGDGRGTAITREAINAAGDVRDLWIVADGEDRPKQLYARLGFRPAWTAVEFLRLP
jgi:GNAT superfamily N-acetyltransferase